MAAKRIFALAGCLLAFVGCTTPTAPPNDLSAAQAKALLEAASQAGVAAGRSLN